MCVCVIDAGESVSLAETVGKRPRQVKGEWVLARKYNHQHVENAIEEVKNGRTVKDRQANEGKGLYELHREDES